MCCKANKDQRYRGRGLGGWDNKHANPNELPLDDVLSNFSLKRREVYCGNLADGQADSTILSHAIMNLFLQLPAFTSAYPDVPNPVLNVAMPSGQGKFAFVELVDEVMASTLILMSGFEVLGRPVRTARPQGYEKPSCGSDLNTLDVTPLRRCGLLPLEPVAESVAQCMLTSSIRELCFRNLALGVSEKQIGDLLIPICLKLPEYNPEQGPPVTKIEFNETSTFCFVKFQNGDLTSQVISIFNGMEFFGRQLHVGRSADYYPTIQRQNQSLPHRL